MALSNTLFAGSSGSWFWSWVSIILMKSSVLSWFLLEVMWFCEGAVTGIAVMWGDSAFGNWGD